MRRAINTYLFHLVTMLCVFWGVFNTTAIELPENIPSSSVPELKVHHIDTVYQAKRQELERYGYNIKLNRIGVIELTIQVMKNHLIVE